MAKRKYELWKLKRNDSFKQRQTYHPDVEAQTCPICLDDIANTAADFEITKCHHTFHIDCLNEWDESNNKYCPCCRFEFYREK